MDPVILLYGAGAIGCTIYKWLKPFHNKLTLLAREKTAESIRKNGLGVYEDSAEKIVQNF